MRRILAFALAAALAATSSTGGNGPLGAIHVDDDAPSGGDGRSWATAYRFLSDALRAAAAGREIRVAGGVYRADESELAPTGTGERSATFALIDRVALRGGYVGLSASGGDDPNRRDWNSFPSRLSGDLRGDDVFVSVYEHYNTDENSFTLVNAVGLNQWTTLDGFQLTDASQVPAAPDPNDPNSPPDPNAPLGGGGAIDAAGSSVVICNCEFRHNGGGFGNIRIVDGSPRIENCRFELNTSNGGGAIYVDRGAATIAGCSFVDNFGAAAGGAIVAYDATLTILDSSFEHNLAVFYAGGAIAVFRGTLLAERSRFSRNDSVRFGGAVFVHDADATLVDCAFDENVCLIDNGAGGAVAHETPASPSVQTKRMSLRRCTFVANRSSFGGGALAALGAGAAALEGVLEIVDCEFVRNDSLGAAGILAWNRSCRVLGSAFRANTAELNGGAISHTSGELIIHNSSFLNNSADYQGLYGLGGAIGNAGAPSEGRRCAVSGSVFVGNRAAEEGGALWLRSTIGQPAHVVNCTFRANSAPLGGVIRNNGAALRIENSILWESGAQPIAGGAEVNYSDVEGGFAGAANFSLDPLFADADPNSTDASLLDGSPCIDAGDNGRIARDELDLDGDGDADEPTPLDATNRLRRADHLATVDSGAGGRPIVDLGAPERQCAGDLDGDGALGLSDLATLLAQFGTPRDAFYPHGDLDRDGDVDLTDLAILLANFGSTCL